MCLGLAFSLEKEIIGYDNRPDMRILQHPYFWDSHKRLIFLQDASDRFETMCPRLSMLETGATEVVGNDWLARLDKVFVENLGSMMGRMYRIC